MAAWSRKVFETTEVWTISLAATIATVAICLVLTGRPPRIGHGEVDSPEEGDSEQPADESHSLIGSDRPLIHDEVLYGRRSLHADLPTLGELTARWKKEYERYTADELDHEQLVVSTAHHNLLNSEAESLFARGEAVWMPPGNTSWPTEVYVSRGGPEDGWWMVEFSREKYTEIWEGRHLINWLAQELRVRGAQEHKEAMVRFAPNSTGCDEVSTRCRRGVDEV